MTAAGRHARRDPGLKWFVIASLLAHGFVVAGGNHWAGRERRIVPVYNVRLVAADPGGGPRAAAPAAQGEAKASAPPEVPAAEPAKAVAAHPPAKPVPAPQAAVKPAPAAKAAKRPAVVPAKPAAVAAGQGKTIPGAAKAAKGKTKDQGGDLGSALADVKKMFKTKGSPDGIPGAAGVPAQSGSGLGGKEAGALAIQIYAGQVQAAIERHWLIPPDLQKAKAEVQLGIRVGDDGTVKDVWVDRSSGLAIFDESALRAVRAAGQFPPPPQSKNGVFEFYSRFTPQGAARNE